MKDDRGVAAPLLAVMFLGLLGVAALAVDMGNNWQNQRALSGATDASVLAAAQDFAFGVDGCATVAEDYLTRNYPGATLESCVTGGITDGTGLGWVTVRTRVLVEQVFGRTLGLEEVPISFERTALFGFGRAGAQGVRPLGICRDTLDQNDDFNAWLAAGGESAPIRIGFTKDSPSDCNSSGDNIPGNWGVMDFDGGSNRLVDTRDGIANGFPGLLSPNTYSGDPGGVSNSVGSELQGLVDDDLVVTFPLYSNAEGNGANSTFEVTNFISARLTDYKVNGSQKSRYLEFVFSGALTDDACCAVAGIDGEDLHRRSTRIAQMSAAGIPVLE